MVAIKSIKSIEEVKDLSLNTLADKNKYRAFAFIDGDTFCIEVTKSLDIRIYCNGVQLDTCSSQYTALMKSNNISSAVYSMIKAVKSSNYDSVCLLGIPNNTCIIAHGKRFTGKQRYSGVLFVPVLSLELELDNKKKLDTGVYSYLYK